MSIELNLGAGGEFLRTRLDSTGVASGEHSQLVEALLTSQNSDGNNFASLNNTSSGTLTATTTDGSFIVTGSAVFAASDVGKEISGTGIPDNAIIVTFTSSSSVTFATPPTATNPHGTPATASGSITATLRDGFAGTYTETRDLGVVRQLAVLALTLADGTTFPTDLGGTFVFQYSEDGTTASITEVRAISDFASVRDFDLINAGAYFRVMFAPNRNITANETIVVVTTLRHHNDGVFVRLANQEIEETNAAMGQAFAYLKAFVESSGKSINIRSNPTGQLLVGDFLAEIGKGNISGHTLMPVSGYNPSITASTTEDIIYTGTINFLQAAIAVRIKSGGNAADDASGAGARSVLVEGLDSSFDEVSETIATNGASVSSATTQTFIRVNKVTVVDTGTYGAAGSSTAGANTGDITIETTSGTVVSTIQAGVGVSQSSLYTVPNAKTGYILRFSATSDANKPVDLQLWDRISADDVSVPFSTKRLIRRYPGLAADLNREFSTPLSFPAKTDIWVTGTTGSGGVGIASCSYDMILVDD